MKTVSNIGLHLITKYALTLGFNQAFIFFQTVQYILHTAKQTLT